MILTLEPNTIKNVEGIKLATITRCKSTDARYKRQLTHARYPTTINLRGPQRQLTCVGFRYANTSTLQTFTRHFSRQQALLIKLCLTDIVSPDLPLVYTTLQRLACQI